MNKIYFDRLDSTNAYLKNHHRNHKMFDVIIAHEQTKGRGRLDHTWFSSKESLTFSILIKDISEANKALLPYYTGYILHQVLNKASHHLTIKWPNDLLLNHKKIAGILVESVYQSKLQAVIIGVGLNINNIHFPKNLATIASSLKKENNRDYQKEKLLDKILEQFEKDFDFFTNHPNKIIEYCNQHLAFKDQTIHLVRQSTRVKGEMSHIDERGHLIMLVKGKPTCFVTGEIVWPRKQS